MGESSPEVSKKEKDDLGYKVGFDPFKKADPILAEKHRQARRIRKVEKAMHDPKTEKCECCGFPIDAESFSLNCNLLELSELGPGFPLFFFFVKVVGLVLLLGTSIVGIPCLIGNTLADQGSEWQADSESWTLKASVGNNGSSDPIYPLWQCILNVVLMICVLIIYHIAKRKLAISAEEMDLLSTTAKDFTLHVYGLGSDIDQTQVSEFFTKYGRFDGRPAKVVKVNLPYRIKDYIDNTRRMEEINESLEMIEYCQNEHIAIPQSCCGKVSNTNELEKELEVVNKDRDKFEKDLPAGVGRDLVIGQAFVTFETQADARAVERKYGRDWTYRFWSTVFKTLCNCCFKKTHIEKFGSRHITAQIANEPSDIFWENLEVSRRNRIANSIKTWLFTLLAVSVSFGMVYGMKYLGKSVNDSASNQDLSTSEIWKIRIYAIWPSIVIIMINFILGRSTRYFSSFERPHTVTAYNVSVALKLTLAMFINTAVIALVVNNDWRSDWFVSQGLMADATYILISNAFVSPLIYLLSPLVCLHRLRMRKVEKATYVSQMDANTMFENPSVDIAQRYANVAKTVLLTFCYAPLIPTAFLISGAGILAEYWVSKYLLLRRHSWPKRLSGSLSAVMIQVMPWGVLLYSIMNYICMSYLNPHQSQLAFLWMLIMLGYTFFPLDEIVSYLVKIDTDIWETLFSKETYEDMAIKFLDDYDRANPVTAHEGWEWLAELMGKKQMVDKGKVAQLKETLGTSLFTNMRNYANSRGNVDQLEAKKFGAGLLGLGSNLVAKKENLKSSKEMHRKSESVNEIKDVLYYNHYMNQKEVYRKKNDLPSPAVNRLQPVHPQMNSVMPKYDGYLNTREQRVNTLEYPEPRIDPRYAQPAVYNNMPNFQRYPEYRPETGPQDITYDPQGTAYYNYPQGSPYYNYPPRYDQYSNQYQFYQAPRW